MTVRWWYFLVVAGGLLATYGAGRFTHRCPEVTVVVPDAGSPIATGEVTVGSGTATTTVTCEVKPSKPIIHYVKVPGTAPVVCPQLECPTVVCSGTSSVETPPVHAQTDVPLLQPTVVTVHETTPRRTWGIGPSGFVAAGVVRPGLAAKWAPFSWLELHASGSTNGGEADILIDF